MFTYYDDFVCACWGQAADFAEAGLPGVNHNKVGGLDPVIDCDAHPDLV